MTVPAPSIASADLAERLAAREPLTVLDVRDDGAWAIDAPGIRRRHLPAADLPADLGGLAAELSGAPVAVVCNRGIAARSVAERLRGAGVDALVLEHGMRGWIGALQARPVELPGCGADIRQVQRPGRGCLSYVLAANGEALVVDPAPDAAFYVALAAGMGATVTHVFDTHLHADHLSGARALAQRTGAMLHLPQGALARGLAYTVSPLADGDDLTVGDVRLRALALPGHTTDMTGLVVAGRALIAGDSLFVDGLARPDLERGDPEGARAMARTLYATLRERLLPLGPDVVLLPCHTHPGVHAGAVTATLGEIRAAVGELAIDDPDAFADAVLADMPPRPANYGAVIAVNAGLAPFDPELETGGNSCSTR